MRALIDSIFYPLLKWLSNIDSYIDKLSVPMARPLDISVYLGPFALLGPYWITFISTACLFGFIYIVVFIIMSSTGLSIKFKDLIKWW